MNFATSAMNFGQSFCMYLDFESKYYSTILYCFKPEPSWCWAMNFGELELELEGGVGVGA